jgi:hypothetical protein
MNKPYVSLVVGSGPAAWKQHETEEEALAYARDQLNRCLPGRRGIVARITKTVSLADPHIIEEDIE